MTTALLLINIQNDYFPNGRMPLERSSEVCQKAQEALQSFRAKRQPVIHVKTILTQPNAEYFFPCTKGIEFHPNVQPTKQETVIKKHYPNSFKDTNLLAQLKRQHITDLVVAGMMTHLDIDATVRAAYDFGFSITVLHDACTTMSLDCHNIQIPAQTVQHAFMAAFEPTYARVISVREALHTSHAGSFAIA